MAELQYIKTLKTSRGELKVYRDWDSEGALYMTGAQTIKRYIELMDEHPDSDKYGIFWAFSNKQYEEGKARMKQLGFYRDGQKIYSFSSGGFGTSKELIDKFFDFYKERDKKVTEGCDPQEVYIYEYNNHECMLSWDGDEEAYNIIARMYGEEIAKQITRFR